MSDWKNVQYKDGKYRTDEGGGGGGSSTFAGLDDVSFNNIQNGQVPKYNSTTQKWENANETGGGGTVTDVKVDGQSVVNPQTGEAEITMPSVPVQDVQVDGTSVVNQQGVAEITMPTPPTIPVTDVKVNGTSVVDANKEAQITSYKEVTQAEYNALPASKTSDDILYCIKDAGGTDGFPPLIYSDEEREVGVWRDGKPLYQKTINMGQLTSGGDEYSVAHNISNIEYVIDIQCVAKNPSGNFYPVPIYRTGQTAGIMIGVSSSHIFYRNNWTAMSNVCYCTVQYTKTTDTAGSGTWTTQGGYAHHYSTTEQVFGTWIDGKPLYEKVLESTMPTVATDGTFVNQHIDISDTDIDYPVSFRANLVLEQSGQFYFLPYSNNSGRIAKAFVTSNNNYKRITLTTDGIVFSEKPVKIILQYTKTTD
jgi:hypothetical protein